jgi:hypothetical protein
VYKIGQQADCVYIVKKGEFVVEQNLPKQDTQTTRKLTEMLGKKQRNTDGSLKVSNILSHKLSEL